MSQVSHLYGSDIDFSSTGDLDVADGSALTKQSILRRLMTNPGDYEYHTEYGGGLPKFVGDVVDISEITAVIRGQLGLEQNIAPIPAPQITVTEIANGLAVEIGYYDKAAQSTQLLSFNVTA